MVQRALQHDLLQKSGLSLFQGEVDGFIVSFYENERPLQGLSGWMDWQFHGEISRYLKKGVLTGKAGECGYLPLQKNSRVYHLLLVGAGTSSAPGKRASLTQTSLKALEKNLEKFGDKTLGVSRADVSGLDVKSFKNIRVFD